MTTAITSDAFRARLGQYLDQLTVVDVGAHSAGEGDVYSAALSQRDIVIGFEPNVEECARLNSGSDRRRYFPYAIGDGNAGQFHICRYPLTSSLFEPNTPLLERYENLAELCTVVGREPVSTRRLDDIAEISMPIDFLKLDIQGGTLSALAGAERMLTRTLVIHAETEFSPIYKGEPLFSECDSFLRERGFMFHHFHRTEGRRVVTRAGAVGIAPSQTLWADSVFVPSFDRLNTLSAGELIRFAWIMHASYGASDFAMLGFATAAESGGQDFTSEYRELLVNMNALSASPNGAA